MKCLVEWLSLLGLACLVAGCGSPAEDAQGDTRQNGVGANSVPYWRVEAREYPYLGESGRMVCRVRTHEFPDGSPPLVDVEEYEFDVMNELLQGRGDLHSDLLESMQSAGITSIETCDEARSFVSMRNAFEGDPASIQAVAAAFRDADVVDPGALPEEPADALVDKVAFGYEQYWGYSVRIQVHGVVGACSAVLIGPKALLTAQHCVRTASNQFIYVDYGVNSTTNCISPFCSLFPPSGWGPSAPSPNARVFRFPNYTNNAANDLALVVPMFGGFQTSWAAPANTSSSWIRMYRDVAHYGDEFWIMGYGFAGNGDVGGGVSRVSNYRVSIESNNPQGAPTFGAEIVSSGTRFCHMDSGGPAVNDLLFTNDVVLGLASRADFSDGNTSCPSPGDWETWTALWGKVPWITTQLANQSPPIPCNQYTGGNGTYVRCW